VLTFELESKHIWWNTSFHFSFELDPCFLQLFLSLTLCVSICNRFDFLSLLQKLTRYSCMLLWCVETKRIVRRCNVCFSSFGVCFFCLQKKLDARRWRIDVASMNFFFDSISCRSSAFVKGLVLLSMMKRKNCVVFGHSKLWKRLRCFFFLFCRKRTRQMFILSAEQCSLVNCYSFLRCIFHVYTAFSCSW
jgi:hypothetical protein